MEETPIPFPMFSFEQIDGLSPEQTAEVQALVARAINYGMSLQKWKDQCES